LLNCRALGSVRYAAEKKKTKKKKKRKKGRRGRTSRRRTNRGEKEKNIIQRERYSGRQYTAYGRVGVSDTFTTLMVPRQCPLVLLVKLRW